MAYRKLDNLAIADICAAVNGLTGKLRTARIQEMARLHEVAETTIYNLTADLRPKRKERADKGKRRADLLTHEGLLLVADLVHNRKLDPDLAIETAELNGHTIPYAVGSVRRLFREHGLDKKSRTKPVRAYRRWEAKAPGELMQIDASGFKQRYLDINTRKLVEVSILDESKNHELDKPNLCKVWGIVGVDDHSRRRVVRFYAVPKLTSIEIVDFCLYAFRKLGVPKILYSDNDAVIIGKRGQRMEAILNHAFAESGGFRLDQHLAGNPQGTGKVEVSHKVVQKYQNLVGLHFEKPSLDDLNYLAEQIEEKLDWTVHRATGMKPILRWRASQQPLRVPTDDVLDWAFKCEEFERQIRADLTISYKGVSYQLPGNARFPFVNRINQKVTIVWPYGDSSVFYVIGLDGKDYEIEKKLATADAAGEFKQHAESKRQQTVKILKAHAAKRKADFKETGKELLVPGIDAPFQKNTELRPDVFPRPVEQMPVERLAEMAPIGVSDPTYIFWKAYRKLIKEGALTNSDEDRIWLETVYAEREQVAESELRTALTNRENLTNHSNLMIFKRRVS